MSLSDFAARNGGSVQMTISVNYLYLTGEYCDNIPVSLDKGDEHDFSFQLNKGDGTCVASKYVF